MQAIRTPEFAESIFEASVGKWFKREGDEVQPGDVIVELHTDKAVQELSASEAGKINRILKKEDEIVRPGDVLCEVAGLERHHVSDKASLTAESVDSQAALDADADEATELVDVEADDGSELIEIQMGDSSVAPSISEPDSVELHASDPQTEAQVVNEMPSDAKAVAIEADEISSVKASLPDSVRELSEILESRPVRRERLSRRRLTMAHHMARAQSETVMTTTFNEVDMHEVMRMRSEQGEAFMAAHEVKLGFMSFFVKAAVAGLKAFPVLNSELQDREIVYKEYYDIGIAVASDQGLAVPVLRNADQKSFAELERDIAEFAGKAKSGSFALEDLMGGTFTITNGGVFGSMMSTPILNSPQVGILGMHNIVPRPVAMGDEIMVRPMMYLAVTYDHRVVEGSQAVQFLRRVKENLESADRLLLGI